MSSGGGAVVSGAEAVSGVQLVDPLFTGFDEGIDGGPIAAGHGSEDGSVNDPFVGFGGGGGVEGGKVFQRLFEFGFGLGGVALNCENEEVAPGAGVAGLSATVHCT